MVKRVGVYVCMTLWCGIALAACTSPDDATPSPDPLAAENPNIMAPIDTARFQSPDEASSWPYQRATEADLDGDGRLERVVLTADVAIDGRGRPAWDDGQRWAVYVIEADSTSTLLYGRFVQLGAVEASITASADGPHVTIHEHGPHLRVAWEMAYGGPGEARMLGRVGGIVEGAPDDILELAP